MRGELLARLCDAGVHLVEDLHASLAGLCQSLHEDLPRDAAGLVVHLERRDAVAGAGDLEVHVAVVVLEALNVSEDRILAFARHQPHGDACHLLLDRHARGHHREAAAADAGHRAGTVGLKDIGDLAHDVGELLFAREHSAQSLFGQSAVSDLAASGAAHRLDLSHRIGREVVVQDESLGGLVELEAVEHLVVGAQHAERGDAEGLGLAAREERGAVGHRQNVDLAGDGTDLVHRAAVGAALLVEQLAAHAGLDHLVHSGRDIERRAGILLGELVLRPLLGGRNCGSARHLGVDLHCVANLLIKLLLHPFVDLRDGRRLRQLHLGLADLGHHALDEVDDLADSL